MINRINRESITFFEQGILRFYREYGRKHLPWRKKNITLYEVWVSEIMLQQTQVDRVIGFYTRFLERFPTVYVLAQASWEEFLPYYQGLGYYNRGRNMLETARVIVRQHNGIFPSSVSELEKFPGVGIYTARAIASFGKGKNYLAWDTNFSRVFGRFFGGSKDVALEARDFESKICADKRDFNGAIMDFGSLICVRRPKCDACPLKRKCLYFQENGKKEYRKTKKIESFPTKEARVFVFLHKEHKVYYSESVGAYKPFFLDSKNNSREGIKRYFQEKYGLSLSVRPPHRKVFIEGVPTIFVNAQILWGRHNLNGLGKKDVQNFLESCK